MPDGSEAAFVIAVENRTVVEVGDYSNDSGAIDSNNTPLVQKIEMGLEDTLRVKVLDGPGYPQKISVLAGKALFVALVPKQ